MRAHLTDDVKFELARHYVDIAVIPDGLTSMLQPLDVCLNKPFKNRIRDLWSDWMITDVHTYTPAGHQRAPTKELVLQWVKDAWTSIPREMIQKSFSNDLNGEEDDAIWDDNFTLNAEDDQEEM